MDRSPRIVAESAENDVIPTSSPRFKGYGAMAFHSRKEILMIAVPRSTLLAFRAVVQRALPKGAREPTVHLAAGKDGVWLRCVLPDLAIALHDPAPSPPGEAILSWEALMACEGRVSNVVKFQTLPDRQVEASWEQAGQPCQRRFTAPPSPTAPFPTWPKQRRVNGPDLLPALWHAMETTSRVAAPQAMNHVQMRGNRGELVATDGQQLLLQRGFSFPWKDDVLVHRSPVFVAKELPANEPITVARMATHVLFGIGHWTIALRIVTEARFPLVDKVVAKTADSRTTWTIAEEEAEGLMRILPGLPMQNAEQAPVTVDFGQAVAIRAKDDADRACTEVPLPQSRCDGPLLRWAVNRRYLLRALQLGFRKIHVTSPGEPIRCQDERRVFVCVTLGENMVLQPQRRPVLVELTSVSSISPAVAQQRRSASQYSEAKIIAKPIRRLPKLLKLATAIGSLVVLLTRFRSM
jgi:hypothetical protein